MGSDKPLKPFIRVLIYIGVVLLIIAAIVIICIAVMFFVPGTTILGYQYVSYSGSTDYVFKDDGTSLSIKDITAVEVLTNGANVYIYPNETQGEIKITYNKGISGFTKSINANLSVNTEIINKTFESCSAMADYKVEHNTLVFSATQPTGLFNSSSTIALYVPSDIHLRAISAKTDNAGILFSSKSKTTSVKEVISCDDLYLKTYGRGNVNITATEPIENYFVETGLGNFSFSDITELNANNITFTTESGNFTYANKTKDATINLTQNFTVRQYKKVGIGPQIRIDNLNANFKAKTFNGVFTINNIGLENNNKLVAITTDNSRITFNKVYGQVSIYGNNGNNGDIANFVNIDELISNSEVSVVEAGAGNVNIKTLTGSAGVNTTSGFIKIEKAKANSNVYAHSTTGNIYINYNESEEDNTSFNTTVLTNSGNIDLGNISNSLNLTILGSSVTTLNLTFSGIAKGNNYINANNCNININLKGAEEALQHRIASTNKVVIPHTSEGAAYSEIFEGDEDYFLDKEGYKDYNYSYRIGYDNLDLRPYDSWGKILIKTTGTTTVRAYVSV